MAELTNIVNELLKGKRKKENLSLYEKGMRSLYHREGWLYLAFHYYSFGEIFLEMNHQEKESLAEDVDQIEQFLDQCIGEPSALSYETITAFRNELTEKVRSLTNYADRLMIYEYLLNRVEFRFKTGDFTDDYYYHQLENDILQYVTNDRDNSVINMKLSQLVGELPMRLSKNKFYDLLREALSIYKGSEQKTVCEFLERIRSAGTLEPVEDGYFNKLFDQYEQCFLSVDFETISEEQYDVLRMKLEEATGQIEHYTDWYVMITDIINDLCTIALTEGALYAEDEQRIVLQIISGVHKAVSGGEEIDEALAECFVQLEGIPEKLTARIRQPEDALTEIMKVNQDVILSEGLTEAFRILAILSRLQSTSTFAELTETEGADAAAGEEFLEQQLLALTARFEERFASCDRMRKRAIMAAVLQNLPSFFNSLEEFQKYVHIALSQCNDAAERQACMTLIHMIMAEE